MRKPFFSNEDRGSPGPFDPAFELEAACLHEAGHAVVGPEPVEDWRPPAFASKVERSRAARVSEPLGGT